MKKFEKEEARRIAEEEAMKAYPFSPTVRSLTLTLASLLRPKSNTIYDNWDCVQVPPPPPPVEPEAAQPAPSLPVFERLLSNNKKFMQSVLSQGNKCMKA